MSKNIVEIIKKDGVGVLPTDTLYGLVGSAFSKKAVEKIYDLKSRSERKSLIILISSIDDLKLFGVELTDSAKKFMKKYWPGKVSIVLPFKNNKLFYLDKMGGTLAFRFPKKGDLISLIREAGPIVAPSANPEGRAPAKNIDEAKMYFDGRIDFYVDGGKIDSEPSTLVKIVGDKIEVLREGAVKVVESL
ncbi:MAG: threonylcarbamoyl-AMP synthase [Flavobacterium sp.]|nr:threonylcarbamoyl-AMP synthase [Flavobacterium sp.]